MEGNENVSGNKNEIEIQNFNKLREEDVGISEYIYKDNIGFDCVLKHRYSDFLVNEIDMEGNVVWLRIPKSEDDNSKDKINNSPSTKEEVDFLVEKNFAETKIINNPNDLELLKNFIFNCLNSQESEKVLYDEPLFIEFIDDKNSRKLLHEKIRELFPFLETETLNEGQIFKPKGGNSQSKKKNKKDDRTQNSSESSSNTKINCAYRSDKKQIVLFVNTNQNNFYRRRKNFPENKKWLHLVMLKRNYDTVQAVSYIARILHRSNKTIKFAGNKDKRGITTQKISIFSTLPEEITNLTKQKFWDKRIELGNFDFKEEELRLGLLKGNQFSVVFRFLEFTENNNKEKDISSILSIDQEIEKCIDSLKEKGFINYFGMQRFGVSTIPTHKIGINVIKKQWKEAIINILNTQLTAEALRQIGILRYSTRNVINSNDNFDLIATTLEQPEKIKDLLKIIPRYSMEYKILSTLKKTGKNAYLTCFKSLNRQLQVLYPHAYQSYIWNKTVSDRIRLHGFNLCIGDIVKKKMVTAKDDEKELDVIIDSDDIVNCEENENETEIVENGEENEGGKLQPIFDEKIDKIFEENYEYITDENIKNYSIEDLYLPMVGYLVKYPKNVTFEIISKYLEEDGIKLEDFAYQNVNFNSTGYFRRVVEKPKDIQYEIIHHDDPDEDLQNEYYNVEPHPKPMCNQNKYTSLRLQFQLTQCTYATMLFRELTKKSSSTYYQANLSKNMK